MILEGLKGITTFSFEEAYFVFDVSGDCYIITYCIFVQVLAIWPRLHWRRLWILYNTQCVRIHFSNLHYKCE